MAPDAGDSFPVPYQFLHRKSFPQLNPCGHCGLD